MTAPQSSGSRRWIIILLVVLLLVIAIAWGMCQRKSGVAVAVAPGSAPKVMPLQLPAGVEVVSRNEAAGLIVLRDKASGATVQLHLADANPDAIERAIAPLRTQMHEPPPKATSAAASSPAVVAVAPEPPPLVKASAGPGGAAPAVPAPAAATRPQYDENLPDFVPLYPGATTIKIASTRDHGRRHGDYEFSTPDSPDQIGQFYAKSATEGGLMMVVNVAGTNASGATFTLIAENTAANKSLSLTAGVDAGKTHGSIEFVAK